MNLPFKEQFAGVKTYFPQKIWQSLELTKPDIDKFIKETKPENLTRLQEIINYQLNFTEPEIKPKFHTIRSGKKWKAGMLIHFCIGLRTKFYLRFAPVIPVVSVQDIEITWKKYGMTFYPSVCIDGRFLHENEVLQLAINDGFNSTQDFLKWFNKDFSGQIIHWTNLSY